jgi:hypothetical protein
MTVSRMAWRAGVTLLAGLALAACEMPPGSASEQSRIRLLLTDAPGPDIESAVVWISRAYLVPGEEGEAVVVTDEPQEHDLLLLQNGVTALLGDASVPAGTYAQLRLVVDSARLTLADGFTFDDGSTTKSLRVPSGAQTGIKVNFAGGLDLTGDVDVVVDFDVAQNFVFQGPPQGPYRVLFTPHLKGSAEPLQPT